MKALTACARRCLTIGAVAFLSACAHKGPPPMYLWEDFPRWQYDTLLAPGNSGSEQITGMEVHAAKARAAGAALPPGFRAHLGMLKLAVGDLDQARDLWQSEKDVFPESAPYMDQLLKRLSAPAKPGNPA